METGDTSPVKPKLPDPVLAFNAIIRDIGLVFNLDYRHATFKKWHRVVGTALDMFLGPMHPKTLEFHTLKFKHAETAETPEGKSVPVEDEMTFSADLDIAKAILEHARNECREKIEDEARKAQQLKEEPAAAAAPPPPAPPMEIHIIKNNDTAGMEGGAEAGKAGVDDGPMGRMKINREEPAAVPPPAEIHLSKGGFRGGSLHFDFGAPKPAEAGEEAGEAGSPEEAVPEIHTAGKIAPTLETFIKGLDDPQERALVERLREELDNPGSSWTDVRMVLEEILDFRRETALRLLPVIVKR